MPSEVAIEVRHISKRFRIYESPLAQLLQCFSKSPRYREWTALDGVSLVVHKGETVGIVGRNGSGKSTLLQIICGTLSPTEGEVAVHGRVAALLELGAGFNPEFSGRENVYMNAAILGLSREQTQARFAAIEAFAEIGEFIDQPVKTYSSGMMVRLAFSVAISVDPQILIIDEALAVGDELFQRRCYARIEALKQQGATILFVSHSSQTVVGLCDRVILLDGGQKLTEGQPKTVVGLYQRLLNAAPDKVVHMREQLIGGNFEEESVSAEIAQSAVSLDDFDPHLISKSVLAYSSRGAVIINPELLNARGQKVNCLRTGETYFYVYQVQFEQDARYVRFGMLLKTTAGVELGGATSAKQLDESIDFVKAGSVLRVSYRFTCHLNEGVYFLNAGVSGDCGEGFHHLHRLVDALCFRVKPEAKSFVLGTVDFGCVPEWSLME